MPLSNRSLLLFALIFAGGCSSTESSVSCGPGTVLQDGVYIPPDGGTGDTFIGDVSDFGGDTAKPDVAADINAEVSGDATDAEDMSVDVADADGKADAAPVKLPWTRHYGGTGDDHPLGVLANSTGETVVHGFSQSSSLDLGKGAIAMPTGTTSGILAKIDPAGSTVWTKLYWPDGGGDIGPASQAFDSGGNPPASE